MRRSNRLPAALIFVVAGLFALSGCSNGGEQGSSRPNEDGTWDHIAYDFLPDVTALNPSKMGEPAAKITVTIPESLIEASAPQGQGLLFTTATITPREVAGVTYCAADVAPEYKEGGLERLQEPEITEQAALEIAEATAQNEIDDFLSNWGASTPEELAQLLKIENGPAALNPEAYFWFLDDAGWEGSEIAHQMLETEASAGQPAGTWQQAVDKIIAGYTENVQAIAAEQAADAAAVPVPERVARNLGFGGTVIPIADLDPENPQEGFYISEDNAVFTVVDKCATSPYDDENTGGLAFPTDVDNKIGRLASIRFSMMQNGTVALTNTEVNGFILDSNNDWIAD